VTPGLVIAAPASGSGKTVITLGLLRALRETGIAVASLKVGPDYIDGAFHQAASAKACRCMDPWAMREETRLAQLAAARQDTELILAEGVMGLFDGAADGTGSTADMAEWLDWPVILVIDVRGQAASAAALIQGFANHRPNVKILGVIFNRVGSERHRSMIEAACGPAAPPILGWVPNDEGLSLPSRHLGLVQADEHADLENWIAGAGRLIGDAVDLAELRAIARPGKENGAPTQPQGATPLPPLGRHMAVARDEAFAFTYPHMLDGWRRAGARLTFFSPLDDEAPEPDADGIYLPGGYPELHAGRLAAAANFLGGLRQAAERGAVVYGECGGFMVLGETLVDAGGEAFAMAGLLPCATSFARRRLSLGYRAMELAADGPLGKKGSRFRGHEFHYSRLTGEGDGEALFQVRDAAGANLPAAGLRRGRVMGSFIHIIDWRAF
jgi:cobyrinic acid a,c-diamide synthase